MSELSQEEVSIHFLFVIFKNPVRGKLSCGIQRKHWLGTHHDLQIPVVVVVIKYAGGCEISEYQTAFNYHLEFVIS